jgi:septal ring factor EnvC (AmiA/AmiB activator)
MALKSRSLASTINSWKILVGGFDKHRVELTFAGTEAESLRAVAAQTESLNIKQEQQKADLAKTTEQLKSLTNEGNRYSASLLRFAKGKFGPRSKEIKDFVSTGER